MGTRGLLSPRHLTRCLQVVGVPQLRTHTPNEGRRESRCPVDGAGLTAGTGQPTCTGLELWPNLQRAGAWRTQIFSQEVGHGQAVNMDAKHRAEVRGSGLEWEEQRGDWPQGQDRRARWGDSRQLMGLWGAEAVGCEGATHPADGGRGCEQPGRSLRCAVSSVYVSASPTRPGGGSLVAGRLAGPRQKLTRGSFIPMFHFNTASSLVSSLSFPKVPGKKSSPHFHIQPTSSWVIA